MKIPTRALLRLWADAVVLHSTGAHDGPLYQPYLGLYTAISTSPSPDSVFGDLTECTIGGYARVQINVPWIGPIDSSDGRAQLRGPLVTWGPGLTSPFEVLLGLFWADASTAGNLLGLDPFDSPISIPNGASALTLEPQLSLPFAANYGGAIVLP